jgi:hypothetical protein
MPLSAERSLALRIAGVLLLALASFWLPKLALPACFIVLLVAMSLPRLRTTQARLWARTGVVFAGVLSAGAFAGFVLHEAIPGVIAGGNQDAERRAIGFLRNLVVAEDHARTNAWLDHDADGIGSAASFKELAGLSLLRYGIAPNAFPLFLKPEQVLDTGAATFVVQGAYLYKLCLPIQGGGFTDNSDLSQVDAEQAERSYAIYAWPRSFAPGSPTDSFYVDAYERILQSKPSETQTLRFQGEHDSPACDSVVTQAASWAPWKGKTARPALPGDKPTDQGAAR